LGPLIARSTCLTGMGAAERWAQGYGGERAHRLSSQIPAGEVIDRLKSRRALGAPEPVPLFGR
jgi:hypothetical protein